MIPSAGESGKVLEDFIHLCFSVGTHGIEYLPFPPYFFVEHFPPLYACFVGVALCWVTVLRIELSWRTLLSDFGASRDNY